MRAAVVVVELSRHVPPRWVGHGGRKEVGTGQPEWCATLICLRGSTDQKGNTERRPCDLERSKRPNAREARGCPRNSTGEAFNRAAASSPVRRVQRLRLHCTTLP